MMARQNIQTRTTTAASQDFGAVLAIGLAIVLSAAAGVLAGAAMGYLEHHGPSGSFPVPWSYTGNGALAVFAYVPVLLWAGWSVILAWLRGLPRATATITGLGVIAMGVVAGLVNEVGVIGQLPRSHTALLVYSCVANIVVSGAVLYGSLALFARLGIRRRRALLFAGIPTLLSVAFAVALSLVGLWDTTLSLTQSLFASLPILVALVAGWPEARGRRTWGSRSAAVLGVLIVPFAFIGGFMVEELVSGLLSG